MTVGKDNVTQILHLSSVKWNCYKSECRVAVSKYNKAYSNRSSYDNRILNFTAFNVQKQIGTGNYISSINNSSFF